MNLPIWSDFSEFRDCLAPGAAVVIISFHSGEDRRVKHAFREGLGTGHYAQISPDPIIADARAGRQPTISIGQAAMGTAPNPFTISRRCRCRKTSLLHGR